MRNCEMYKWIIFDIDGTLIETSKSNIMGLRATMNDIFNKNYEEEDLIKYMGIPGDEALRNLNIPEEKIESVWKYWQEKVDGFAHYNYIFDGVCDMLYKLSKKYSLAIVTSKTKNQLQKDLGERGILDYFKVCICKEDTERYKPNPDPLIKALQIGDIKVKDAIYIGDALCDYLAAKSIEMNFGHCRFNENYENVESNIVFNNSVELLKFFETL